MEAQPASENAQAVPSPVEQRTAGTPTGADRNTPTPNRMPQGLILPSMQDSAGGQAPQQVVIPQQSLPMNVPGMPPGMAHMGNFMNQQQLMQMLDPLQQNGGQQPPATQPSQPPPPKPDPATLPKPPRKPLTPYMRFSKAIWQKVKNANPSMSVCEVGSTIGKMWREMGDVEKQKYNDEFLADKQRYDVDLQEYLKVTGLTTADMQKKRDKKKVNDHHSTDNAKRRKMIESAKQPTVAQHLQMRNQMTNAGPGGNQQQIQMPPGQPGFPPQQQFMMGPGASSTLPHFSQVWAGQNFTPQQQAQMFMMPGLIQQQQLLQQQQQQQQQQQVVQNEQLQQQQQVVGNATQAGQIPAQMVVYPSQAQDGSQVLVGANLPQQAVPAMFQAQEQPAAQTVATSAESTPTTINQAVHQETRSETPQQQQQQAQPEPVTQGGEGGTNPPGWPWHMVQQQLVSAHQQQTQQNMAGSPGTPQNQDPSHSDAHTPNQSQGPPSAEHAGENSVPNGSDTPGVQESHPNAVDMTVTQEGSQAETTGDDKSSAQFNNAGAHYLFSAYGPQGPYGQPPPYNGRPVVSKESVMESELQHLRTALSEKTKEVQRLSQELEKAYETMERMKQERPQFNV